MTPATSARKEPRLSSGGRWMVVGALGFVVQVAIIRLALSCWGMPIHLATALGVMGAVFHNFWWHERWTWRDRTAGRRSTRWQRLTTFCGLSTALTVVANVALTTTLTSWLGADVAVANLLAVLVLAVGNWLVADRVIFREATSQPDASPRATRPDTRSFARADSTVAWLAVFVSLAGVPETSAAELRPRTIAAWDALLRRIESRIQRELAGGAATGNVLWAFDEGVVQRGDVFIEKIVGDGDLPDGSLHHWRASMLMRGVTLDDLLTELQSDDGRRHVQADVLQWRLIARRGDTMRVFIRMRREEIVTAVYNTEHDVRYERHGPSSASSRSVSLRIAEVEGAGSSGEREAPEGRDRGFLWRMNSYWRYQQRPDGVVVQVESVTLSRQVPSWLSPVATPLINKVARESLIRTLEAVRFRMRSDLDARPGGLSRPVAQAQ